MNQAAERNDLPGRPRALAVVDWAVDADSTAAALAQHARRHGARLSLLVPARLRGLDWAGDPRASRSCAERQLAELRRLLEAAGLEVDDGWVGDPETVPAVDEALGAWAADEVLILGADRGLNRPRPLSVSRRLGRATGLPVRSIRVAASGRRRRPHCDGAGAPLGR